MFDPVANSWDQSDFFHLGLDHLGSPLYFTTGKGYYLQPMLYQIYEFDPLFGWSRLATLSNNILYTVNDQDDIIFIDGYGNVELIDSNNWGTKAVLPPIGQNGIRNLYFGAITNDRLYIGLGEGPEGCYDDMIYLDLNDYR